MAAADADGRLASTAWSSISPTADQLDRDDGSSVTYGVRGVTLVADVIALGTAVVLRSRSAVAQAPTGRVPFCVAIEQVPV